MDIPGLQKIMSEFERENEKAEATEDMIGKDIEVDCEKYLFDCCCVSVTYNGRLQCIYGCPMILSFRRHSGRCNGR